MSGWIQAAMQQNTIVIISLGKSVKIRLTHRICILDLMQIWPQFD